MSKIIVPLAAISSITIMETWALAQGHDGLLFTIAVALVAAIAGAKVGDVLKRIR